MTAITKPVAIVPHLPRWPMPRLFGVQHRRRQATIDLIHASPHLLRDIGATNEHFSSRRSK